MHVGTEDNPERLRLDDSITERARARVYSIMIRGVGDNVEAASLAAKGVLAKPNAAIGQTLAVQLPIRVASPAVVDRVASLAGG